MARQLLGNSVVISHDDVNAIIACLENLGAAGNPTINRDEQFDFFVAKFVDEFFPRAGISKVVIRKTAKEGEVIIFSSKVGVLMGKQ